MSTNAEKRLQQQADELMIRLAASEEARKKVVLEMDELRRKLAEQQAIISYAKRFSIEGSEAKKCLNTAGDIELTKLLEEAKVQGANEMIGRYMPDFSLLEAPQPHKD